MFITDVFCYAVQLIGVVWQRISLLTVTERRNRLQSEITDMMTTFQITGTANVLLLLRKDGCICIRDINFIESNCI